MRPYKIALWKESGKFISNAQKILLQFYPSCQIRQTQPQQKTCLYPIIFQAANHVYLTYNHCHYGHLKHKYCGFDYETFYRNLQKYLVD